MEHFTLRFDDFDRMQFSLAATGTDLAGVGPIFGAFQVAIPKRPCATLAGPSLVDRAAAGLAIKENAVAVVPLDQASPRPNSTDKLLFKLGERFVP
jgi:hypothetical protein